jgi:hypothetical protein
MAAGASGSIGVMVGRLGWFRFSDGTGPGDAGADVHVLWLDFFNLEELTAASSSVVVGKVMSVRDRTIPVQSPGSPRLGDNTQQIISLEVVERWKGDSPATGRQMDIVHSTRVSMDDPKTGARGYAAMEDGALRVQKGSTVVAFLSLGTDSDGSPLWGFAGQPGLAEVRGTQLVFLASPRYRAELARRGLQAAPNSGDSPFAATIPGVRLVAAASPDPREVDAPRDSVPAPTVAAGEKPTTP